MNTRFRPLVLSLALLCAAGVWCGAQSLNGTNTQTLSDQWEDAATAAVQVQQWSKPERGWLYILDPQPEPDAVAGRIWLLDPAAGKVTGSVSTGAEADFALSPDGTRLYVASKGKDRDSNIVVIDTSMGVVTETRTVESRVVPSGVPPFSVMSVSGDGLALRILVNDVRSPDSDFMIDTIDTRDGKLLPNPVNLGKCGLGRFIDDPNAGQFDFLCPINNRIRQVNFDASTQKANHEVVEFPWLRRLGIANAFLARGGGDITIIRGDGAVYNMDVNTANFAKTRMKGSDRTQALILPADWPTSPDGTRVYLGYNLYPNNRFYMSFERSAVYARTDGAYDLRAFDTTTWRQVGKMEGKWSPYWTAVVSPDGAALYALSPENHGIVAFSTKSMHQTGTISVGGMPSLALVAP
jgi:hypothetical protein